MNKNKGSYIKRLRGKMNFTQDYVAREIGVSRPTYILMEKGERELSISEAEKLARLFDMSIEEFLNEEEGRKHEVVLEKSSARSHMKQNIRISVPQKNLKKFKEVLLYILEKVGARPNIGETAIYKLLYFIDFDYYEKFEEQLIGATYIKNKFGPTPVEFVKIVQEMMKENEIEVVKSKYFQFEQKKYLPLRSPDLSVLNARELEHINEVLARLADKSAKELSDYSHDDLPWKVHKMNERISYESVFYRDYEHSVKSYDDEV
ncbi:MAG: type II toxin-antitoxin system antitoxin SocA domain-containing protein [Pseudomonadota bacterium]